MKPNKKKKKNKKKKRDAPVLHPENPGIRLETGNGFFRNFPVYERVEKRRFSALFRPDNHDFRAFFRRIIREKHTHNHENKAKEEEKGYENNEYARRTREKTHIRDEFVRFRQIRMVHEPTEKINLARHFFDGSLYKNYS
jgi:hypothetical protein